MTSQPDVLLPADTWVDITTAVGASLGGNLGIQNTGQIQVRIQESDTEPSATSDLGIIITHLIQAQSTPASSEKVWGRAIGGNSNINVQIN